MYSSLLCINCFLNILISLLLPPVQNKAVPLVPWNLGLSKALNEPAFQLLICQLGLSPQDEVTGLYSRIPPSMTFPGLVHAAQSLGPIENCEPPILALNLFIYLQ